MAKQVTIAFNNPLDESNIDHVEIWKKIGAGGTLGKFGANVPFVTGVAPYSIVDQSADIVDGADVHYEVRNYNATGQYAMASANIVISTSLVVDGVTTTNNQVREGEAFALQNFGSLTGITDITIDDASCTSEVFDLVNDTATAVAPSDGARYGTDIAVRLV